MGYIELAAKAGSTVIYCTLTFPVLINDSWLYWTVWRIFTFYSAVLRSNGKTIESLFVDVHVYNCYYYNIVTMSCYDLLCNFESVDAFKKSMNLKYVFLFFHSFCHLVDNLVVGVDLLIIHCILISKPNIYVTMC